MTDTGKTATTTTDKGADVVATSAEPQSGVAQEGAGNRSVLTEISESYRKSGTQPAQPAAPAADTKKK